MVTRCSLLFCLLASLAAAAPVINPVANVIVPAGKSLIVPITATVTNGRPLTYTITGSTNAIAIVLHTNNPFWKLNVAQACATNDPGAFQTPFRGGLATVTNAGDMTFMLFPEYAPNTVSIFQGLSAAGFYNSNTIFHRIISNLIIQGGDPLTNGMGGLEFEYDEELNPQAIFSGNGQLALANSGRNTDGCQFFVTIGRQRQYDFQYTLFGQLVRGFDVLTNISNTAVDANSRPLANEIITQAGFVPDTCDTVITLVATNRAHITNTVTIVVNDGAGGLATNNFTATTITDTNSNFQPFIYGYTVTNVVAKLNTKLTNILDALELDGRTLFWFPYFADTSSGTNSSGITYSNNFIFRSLTYNVTNDGGQLRFIIQPTTNYAGPINLKFYVSTNSSTGVSYDEMTYSLVFGDTPIVGQAVAVPPQARGFFTNLLLATFTNGVPKSALTNFSASIQWGDDSITPGTIATNSAGWKQVFGSHTYTNSGAFPISVTVQSSLGVTTVVTNTVTVMPSLSPAVSGTNIVIAWPSWAFAYGLQTSTNLAGTNWVTITNAAGLSGFQNVVSNPLSANQSFFRLKH
jgi:cyclophilin family peptidyl-prolyl cis-trans isomerase